MNIIGHRKIFLSISILLILASIIVIFVFGFKPGIDFVGGTMWQIKLTTDNQQPSTDEIRMLFEELGNNNAVVFPAENNSFLIRFSNISEQEHQEYLSFFEEKFNTIEELRFEGIGPAIGKELRNRAFGAIILVLIGISLYIVFAFRKVSFHIKSWKYGIITLITLFHDIVIPAGFFAFLGWKVGLEIDTNFIVALLVIMGFSVHDTIVVFDRIRENLTLQRGGFDLAEVINSSINQTIARSINTSITLIFVLLAMFFFGPITLKYFILIILIGTVFGTYSSIFIASPLLLLGRKSK
ncbi:protein translocase subunit SecF [Candidatus Wolfebacteria bacterium]|nr:protein translocase subunit SecF [Candidatus Wolfebacteria bacterium]